ncbi:MAG TPA: thiazole synthase [Alphaproteobacteria bacterium]|nr:thiazole synthase [Rhodospirillaceae bacterium]HRJ12759.1 thiazole synthase [Alphaproteobacteria bacterium]
MWQLGGKIFNSRLILGTSRYRSPHQLRRAIAQSGAEIVTVSLRRQASGDGSGFWGLLREINVTILPNTANCRSAKEAVMTAQMARDVFKTNWIKLETVGDELTLQPDPFALVEAAQILIKDGFEVFPYTTEDLVVAERLLAAGCKILMPWASPIGSGQGIVNPAALKTLRARMPEATLIVDAGIGLPSHAAHAMEMGYDGVMLNTAVALADDAPKMAEAFARAIEAGRLGYEAGLMLPRQFAEASTPTLGTPFHKESA